MTQRVDRTQQQAAGDQQREGHGHLDRHQAAAQPVVTASCAGLLSALFQRRLDGRPRGHQRGPRGCQHRGQQRQPAEAGENPPVHLGRKIHVEVQRRHALRQPHGHERQPDSQHRGAGAQHQAFDHHLLQKPAAARAQRSAHGNLALPRRGSRQQEIGHVDAGDEPQHAGRRQQGQQGLLHIFVDQRVAVALHLDLAVIRAVLRIRVLRRHVFLDRSPSPPAPRPPSTPRRSLPITL